MAIIDLGSLGGIGSSAADQGSSALTITQAVAVGDLVVVVVGTDNRASGGDDQAVLNVIDNGTTPNKWFKARQVANALAAQAGASCSIWYSRINTAMPVGTNIIANFFFPFGTADTSTLTGRRFSIGAGNFVEVEGTPADLVSNTAADPGALNITTSNIECLRIRGIASRINSATVLTPTSSWTAWASANASGTMQGRAEHLISTGTGASSDPAFVSAIYASAYVAFKEVSPNTVADTWNPFDKAASVTLSNGNLTANTAAYAVGVRSKFSRSTGKYYFEQKLDRFAVYMSMGLFTPAANVDTGVGDAYSFGLTQNGEVGQNGAIVHDYPPGTLDISSGETVGFAVDFDAGKCWFRDSAGWQGDPVAGTGNVVSFPANTPMHVACTMYDIQSTVNFGTTAFTYAVPSGYGRWSPLPGGAVTGTLAVTEVADASAMTGTVAWPPITGTLARTETADTAALTGTTRWLATLATTEAADVSAMTGAVRWLATLAASETADSAAMAAQVHWLATLASSEAPDSFAATGIVLPIVTGTLAASEAADTAAIAGNVLSGLQGALTASEAADSAAVAGQVTGVVGTLTATDGPDTAAGTGRVEWLGTLAAQEGFNAAAFTGAVHWLGILATSEAPDSANFFSPFPINGTLAAAEAGDTAGLAATVHWLGTLAAQEAADSLAGTGQVHWQAALAATDGPDSANVAGSVRWQAVLEASEAPDQASFDAVAATGAVLAASEAPDTAAFTSAPVSIQDALGYFLRSGQPRVRELASANQRVRTLKYPVPRPRDLIKQVGGRRQRETA